MFFLVTPVFVTIKKEPCRPARFCFGPLCYNVTRFVTMATSRENGFSCHEIFKVDGQWLCDHAVKFARWQHPVIGAVAKFNAPGSFVITGFHSSILTVLVCIVFIV